MAKLNSKQKTKTQAVPAELGVLWYMVRHTNADGLFQQHYAVMANEMNSSAPTIHRHLKHLIKLGEVEVVVKSRRGNDGHPTVPVLRPIPSMEWATSGTGAAKPQKACSEMERAVALENKGSKPIPNHEKPLPSGTNNSIGVITDSQLSVSGVCKGSNAARCKTLVGSGSLPPGLPPAKPGCHWEIIDGTARMVRNANL